MQLGEGCFERVFGRRGAMGKAGPDACSLQREFFMGSEGRWERQGLARVRYSVSSFRVLQEVLFFLITLPW